MAIVVQPRVLLKQMYIDEILSYKIENISASALSNFMVKHVDSTTTQILNNISRDVKRYGYQTVKDTIKTFITNNTHTVTKDCLLLATDADNVLCDKLLKLIKLNDRDLYAEYFLRFVISSRTDCYDMI